MLIENVDWPIFYAIWNCSFLLVFFFCQTALERKLNSSWKHIKVLELVDLTLIMSHFMIFTLFLAQTMDDSATKTILKAGKSSSESSEQAAVVRKVLRASRCLSRDASNRAVLWVSFKHQHYTFTASVPMLLAFLRQCVQPFGPLTPDRSWPEDCCWTANVITG